MKFHCSNPPWILIIPFAFATASEAGSARRIALYDPDADGGRSYGKQGIAAALSQAGLTAQAITDLSLPALSRYGVLILPDVHVLGKRAGGWRGAVRAFVRGGGGVLLTHDCRGAPAWELFPEIVTSGGRHASNRIPELSVHPVNFMLVPFRSAYGDHWHYEPGAAGRILAPCPRAPRPASIAVAGGVGKGRVVVIGLALGLDGTGKEAVPNRDERRWILNAVRWLAGEKTRTEADPKRSFVRILVPPRIDQEAQPVAVALRFFLPPGARIPRLTGRWKLRPARWTGRPAGRVQSLSGERRWDDLSSRMKVVERGEAYSIFQVDWDIPARVLPDGAYALSIAIEARSGVVARTEENLFLVGEMQREKPKRIQAMKRRHRGSVIKFAFTQGFPSFPRDEKTYRPFLQALKGRGMTAYDTFPELGADSYVWEEEDFRALEKLCAVAREETLKLWATLIPPSSSETIRKMGGERMRHYYLDTVRRFAEIARRFPEFVGYTCDDFSHNHGFFTPQFVLEMAAVTRRIAPDLAFMPLCYWWGLDADFFQRYGSGIDGVVFHFRCDSQPRRYLPDFDAYSFKDHAMCMRHELEQVRKWAGEAVLICGVYIGYTAYEPPRPAWGVPWAEGRYSGLGREEHRAEDAVVKLRVAHALADGVRIYGLGIKDRAYERMGELLRQWRKGGESWGG